MRKVRSGGSGGLGKVGVKEMGSNENRSPIGSFPDFDLNLLTAGTQLLRKHSREVGMAEEPFPLDAGIPVPYLDTVIQGRRGKHHLDINGQLGKGSRSI